MTRLPPVVSGALPVIGHIHRFMRDRDALLKRGFQEHGQIFSICLPAPTVVVSGSALNRWFYTETDASLNVDKALDFLKAALGEVLLTASKETYNEQRPILKIIFSNERMRTYVQAMNAEVDAWLRGLGEQGELDITADMRRLTQHVAAHAFLGANFREELGEEFWQAYDDIAASLDPLIPPSWPLPKFRRRDRARAAIRRILVPACERRRQDPAAFDDVISLVANSRVLSSGVLDHAVVVDLLMGLLFAGHETTAGQVAWSIILTLQHEPVRNKLEQIARALPLDAPLEAKELRALAFAYHIVDETSRFRPSADLQMRVVGQPVDVAGFHIPKGWRVMVNSAVSHHLDAQFDRPDVFDPHRFDPSRGEGSDSYAFVGFGGGRHKCTGMNFARNEMVVILAKLFAQYDLELITKDPYVVAGVGAKRPSPTLLRYKKRPSLQ